MIRSLLLSVLWLAPMQEPEQTPPKAAPQEPSEKEKSGRSKTGRHDPSSWWKHMSEEEREQARLRWQRYCKMSPESKAELERRHELIKKETERMIQEMPAADRDALMKLDSQQREQKIHHLLRARLKEKAASGELPGPPTSTDFRNQPLEERLRNSKDFLDQRRMSRLQREVDRAVEEGWLGKKAAEFYSNLAPEEVQKELMRFKQWRLLDYFNSKDKWKELGIDDAERKRLSALPPEDFLQQMRKYHRRDGRGGRHADGGRRRSEEKVGGDSPPPEKGERKNKSESDDEGRQRHRWR
ncbi:MAG: hypothetical protein H8E15_06850 [Planctomycetes bacterium]|nr:hypothetical protein [Planctomycetota bacterium]